MRVIAFAIWVFVLLGVGALALTPGLMSMQPGADKMLHMLIFCLLMLWPAMTARKIHHAIYTALLFFSAGLCIEIMQSFVPGRNTEALDILYNTVGIITGAVIGYLLRDTYSTLKALKIKG